MGKLIKKILKIVRLRLNHPLAAFFMSALSGYLIIALGYPLIQAFYKLVEKGNTVSQTVFWFNFAWMSFLGLCIYFVSIVFQVHHKRVIDYLYKKWF